MNQDRMPFVESLERYKEEGMIPFHTPGHKLGQGAPKRLQEWMEPALAYDLGLMYAIDDYHEAEGELFEAQQLAAQAFGADHTWFSINGTSGAIQMMIMSVVGEGDTILIPREAHCSVHHALVLSGAYPVYLEGRFHPRWGIPLGVTREEAVTMMELHPEAKAIVLVNPNYYGVAIELESIVLEAHARGIVVLVDEAHGPHLVPPLGMPKGALLCGADLVAQSTHKLLGSLTQTSMLHGQGPRIDIGKIQRLQQMLMSTSPNYIFLASLDMARHQWATEGVALMERTIQLARKLRSQLQQIPGIACPGLEDIEGGYALDETKIIIDVKGLGLGAHEFEAELRAHHIEVELMKAHHVLLLVTIGDTEASVAAVVKAVQSISEAHPVINGETVSLEYEEILPRPDVVLSPREAFYGQQRMVPWKEARGAICGETITYYPPGIPCIGVGERITDEVVQYIERKQALGYLPNGARDRTLETVMICED